MMYRMYRSSEIIRITEFKKLILSLSLLLFSSWFVSQKHAALLELRSAAVERLQKERQEKIEGRREA